MLTGENSLNITIEMGPCSVNRRSLLLLYIIHVIKESGYEMEEKTIPYC